MKNYYRIILGKGGIYAGECFAQNFIGVDYGIAEDLTDKLSEEWRTFNRTFIPVYRARHPEKTKIAAGLAGGAVWTVCKGIKNGDVVLCPDPDRRYHVGEIIGDYLYQPEGVLPHTRPVRWLNKTIDRTDMNEVLRKAVSIPLAVCALQEYREEIERLIVGAPAPHIMPAEEAVENLSTFAMEKHLEDFLVQNWAQTELGREYDIYEVEGQKVGQQFPTDTGPLDILAVSRDKKKLLVVELKKGRASDAVVGQTLRYMGYVQKELADVGQTVEGVIIAFEDDKRIQQALTQVPTIKFRRYEVSFKLVTA